MTGKAIGIELNQGYVGQPSRQAPVPEIYTRPASADLAFGDLVKVDSNGKFAKFVVGTDTIDKFAGIVTRGVQQSITYTSQNGETGYKSGLPACAMKKGFMTVNVSTSTPTAGGKVYATSAGALTATSTSNTLIPCLRFTTGKKDANNNTEIEICYLPMVIPSDIGAKADV